MDCGDGFMEAYLSPNLSNCIHLLYTAFCMSKKMPVVKKRNHLLDLISDNERFFHYGQDLGKQILQCLV